MDYSIVDYKCRTSTVEVNRTFREREKKNLLSFSYDKVIEFKKKIKFVPPIGALNALLIPLTGLSASFSSSNFHFEIIFFLSKKKIVNF